MAERFIGDELDRQMPEVEKLIDEMQLDCDYKIVTFEVLNDEDFIKANEEKYPYKQVRQALLEQETMG